MNEHLTGSVSPFVGGKYEILTEIGRGGMSVVYLARDTHLNKQWAVKEVRRDQGDAAGEAALAAILREAELLKKLDHPALPRIVDILWEAGAVYIIMDYIEGISLKRYIREFGVQPAEEVLRWSCTLCEALIYLHSRMPPVIYRDMKPGNILLKPDGMVKIVDFGIAREVKAGRPEDTVILGTRGYAPPEQCLGKSDVRSDIFALGMTMRYLLTGAEPSEEVPDRKEKRTFTEEGLQHIIARCTQMDPECRYPDARTLYRDLLHPERITRGYRRTRRRKVIWFFLSVLITVLGAVLGSCSLILRQKKIQETYAALISVNSAEDPEERLLKLQRGIRISPEKSAAYLQMLELFSEDGSFSEAESRAFLSAYTEHRDVLDRKDPDFGMLHYTAGMMYFNYYEPELLSAFPQRIRRSFSFFETLSEWDGEPDAPYRKQADCYFRICRFYRTYLLNSVTVEEASAEEYETLLQVLSEGIQGCSELQAYDRLSYASAVLDLLYDRRYAFSEAAVSEELVLAVLEETLLLSENTVTQNARAAALKERILQDADGYREAVRQAYRRRKP